MVKNRCFSTKIIVRDQSKAILIAVTQSFTQYSILTKYVSVHSDLILQKSADIPNCMIRNVNHIIHLISTRPPMKIAARQIKRFYMWRIALLVTSIDFHDIKILLGHIFTVALCEMENNDEDSEQQLPCTVSRLYLTNCNSGVDFSKNIEEDPLIMRFLTTSKSRKRKWMIFIRNKEDIYSTVKNLCQISDDDDYGWENPNVLYCPAKAEQLLKMSSDIVPCSAVMNQIFGYDHITETSASSESVFKDIKNRVFQHASLPIRLEFIATHTYSM